MRLLVAAVALATLGACKKREERAEPPPGPPEHIDRGKTDVVDDPMFHIRPDEAQVKISSAHAHVGKPTHATVTVVAAPGFHISNEYKTRLDLAGAEVTTSRRTDRELAFDIAATPKVAGEQQLSGFLSVGLCESASCRPRRHPITVAVVGE